MSRTRRLVSRATTAAALVVMGGVIVAGPAMAAEGRIVSIAGDGDKLQVVFSATGLAPGETIDPATVAMQINGRTVPVEAAPVGDNSSVVSTSVLVVDTSGSMQGQRLTTAKAAAGIYLNSVPATERVGLVTFSDKAAIRVKPTVDRQAVQSVIDSLTADGKTALYDGAVAGVGAVGATGPRTVVLLSDGGDTSSALTLPQATRAIKASRAVVDSVSIGTEAKQVAQLEKLSTAGRGDVIASNDLAAVEAAFSSAARTVSNQVALTAVLPVELAGQSGNITVAARAGDTSVADTAFATLPQINNAPAAVTDTGPKSVAAPSGLANLAKPWILALAALLLFAGLAVLLFTAFRTVEDVNSNERKVTRRLSIYTLTGRAPVKDVETSTALGSSGVARSAVDLAGRVVSQRDFESYLALKLERAAVPLKPSEWILIHVGIVLAVALLLLLLTGGSLLAVVIGVAIGVLAPFAYLSRKEASRKKAFAAMLPDTLQLIAGSLSSGYSLPQAIGAATEDAAAPMSTEFDRALVETRLGVPVEDALDGIAQRLESVDFSWVVMAIRIQREVGGNLAEVLNTTAATLRERDRLRRQIDVLSAEGRFSAWILGGLPIAIGLWLVLTRPEYLAPLVNSLLGWVMIGFGIILMIVGVFWLRKTVKVEV